MIDPHQLRHDPDPLLAGFRSRSFNFDMVTWLALEAERKTLIQSLEHLQAERNRITEKIRLGKQIQADTSGLLAQQALSSTEVDALDKQLRKIDEEWQSFLSTLPNMPHASVPTGVDPTFNQLINTSGTPRTLNHPRDHVELATTLGILDLERASKITGARFCILKGLGAMLERALGAFMIDQHVQRGYIEILPPYLVNAQSMYGTGQLPKFESDLFKVPHGDDNLYLIPTAEVPVTNLYRDDVLQESLLPIRHCALTPCFRSEAGSYGKDTKGLIRQHQFHKVELVSFVTESQAEVELERLTEHAEMILEQLELPYRRMLLCSGDMGFSSHKTYDLEVWLPSQNTYREISSCSWFGDFQARRASLKYRPAGPKAKPQFLHTLNGSALAVGRTWVAILENGQQADGSIRLPKALVPYMGGLDRITL